MLIADGKEKQREMMSMECFMNMKSLSEAVRLYSASNNNQLPPAATWCDALQRYVGVYGDVFNCPAGGDSDCCDYAFNAKLGGMAESAVNPKTVLFFETDGGWNVGGGPRIDAQARASLQTIRSRPDLRRCLCRRPCRTSHRLRAGRLAMGPVKNALQEPRHSSDSTHQRPSVLSAVPSFFPGRRHAR